MLGYVTGVNAIAMTALRDSPDVLEKLGLSNIPRREGFTSRQLTMKEFARKRQRVQ